MSTYDTPANEQEGWAGKDVCKNTFRPKKLNQSEIGPNDKKRFEEKVSKAGPDECWLWTGYRNHFGYGVLNLDGTNRQAHRICYAIHVGNVPEGMIVMHKCDNPPCNNPNHLRLGTSKENAADAIAKHRNNHPKGRSHHWFGSNHSGEHHGKLKTQQVVEIRQNFPASGMTSREFAKLYGVNQTTILNIINRKTWWRVP